MPKHYPANQDYSYRPPRPPARPPARRQPAPARVQRRSRLLSPVLIAPLIVLSLIGLGVLTHYYFQYTELIDRGLRGDIFVRSSGIYAAPPLLRPGMAVRQSELIAHLKRVGYSEGATENEKRGSYAVRGNVVEIAPGTETVVDGESLFRRVRVSFNGNHIGALTDLGTRAALEETQVEPELISSIVTSEREKRKIVEYRDLPKNLVDAITTIEDRQFFEHSGINWRGVIRALVKDYQTGELKEGGSSITQQLIKNFWLTPERTLKRKLAEAYLSILLEQRLTKEQIMAMYCNQIYLGQRGSFSINGFGEAARSYFGKDISNLTLAEAALLGGIIRSPNRYSPFTHKERAVERRNFVLETMVEAGKVTRAEADAAKRTDLGVKSKGGGFDGADAPYFTDYLTRQLEAQYDDRTALRSLRIYSTLDLNLQRAAYQAVSNHMAAIDKLFAKRKGGTAGLQAALVAMNTKTGEILAMVGGRDYAASQLNRVLEAKRQPGSVFKPFVYAAALGEGTDDKGNPITSASMFLDAPKTFEYGNGEQYNPGNFKDSFANKKITVRDALVHSKNVITVEIAERIGFSQVARLAERAGLPRVPTYPSMALGTGEATPMQIASAYTIFANKGRRVSPVVYQRLTNGRGTTLLESKAETREILSPQVAYIMTSMMRDVLDRGTGARVRAMGFRATAAGKTGSSRDGWFAGYTPNLVCVVWVGFDNNDDLGLTGGATAAPIWAEFMSKALQHRPDLAGDFDDPGDLLTVDIDPETGLIAQADTPNPRHELFLKGTEPSRETSDEEREKNRETAPPDETRPREPQSAEDPVPAPARPSGERATGNPGGNAQPMISVEVCAVSGLLPVRGLCTRTQWRKFPFGKEPSDLCSDDQHEARARLVGANIHLKQ